jgi:hypothetical protein
MQTRPAPTPYLPPALRPGVFATLRGWPAWRRWVAHVIPGEVIGFGIAAAAGAVAWAAGAPTVLLILAVVAGGSAEGACLGYAQARALRGIVPGVPAGPWVAATVAGAAVAWAFGATAGQLPDFGAPVWVTVAAWAVAGPVMLLAIGGPQAMVLRGHVPGAWRWVVVNVIGWLFALPATFVAGLFVDESTARAAVLGVFIAAGVVMAMIIAAITGAGLLWMSRGPDQGARP